MEKPLGIFYSHFHTWKVVKKKKKSSLSFVHEKKKIQIIFQWPHLTLRVTVVTELVYSVSFHIYVFSFNHSLEHIQVQILILLKISTLLLLSSLK